MRSIHRAPYWIAFVSLGLLAAGCKPSSPPPAGAGAPPTAIPGGSLAAAKAEAPVAPIKPPLELPRPELPSAEHGTLDFSKLQVSQLISMARVAGGQDNATLAAALQRYAVERGSLELYDLACYESRARHLDAALYWLQEAALREGVDAARGSTDPNLKELRTDPRWDQLPPFLKQCQQYWNNSGIDDHQLVLPAGYRGRPLPVLIWLHGENDCAANYSFPELQSLADRQQVAFISVSGATIGGPRKYSWSADMNVNEARIAAARAKFADRLKVQVGQVALAGFSRGGQVAGELAAAQPDRYCGALIMSPSGAEIVPANAPAQEFHRRQQVIVVCGSDEGVGVVQTAKGYAERFRILGATVAYNPYAEMSTHALVPDFKDQLPDWTAKVLRVK